MSILEGFTGPWPDCLGMSVDDCTALINQNTLFLFTSIEPVPQNSFVTSDFKFIRIRLYFDTETDKIVFTPTRG